MCGEFSIPEDSSAKGFDMPCVDTCPQALLTCLLLAVTAVGTGCDQAGEVLQDVKSGVTGEQEQSVAESKSGENPPPSTPPNPQRPTPPTPEEILSTFTKLTPYEISDAALKSVITSSAAAAGITEIEINGEGVTSIGLKYLSRMPNLHTLTIKHATMSAAELSIIGEATSLRQLFLGGSDADDDVLEQLTSLQELQTLELTNAPISPTAANWLNRLPNLKNLRLDRTRIDDTTVAGLVALPLQSLNLSKTRITNASLPILLKIKTLESLTVSITEVTGAAFKGYNKANLKQLDVGNTSFGIDGFMAIRGMQSLEELNVHNAGLVEHTNANVFRSFPNLKILNAGENSITNAGLEVFFKGHRSLEQLNLGGNKWITNNGLASLVALRSLKVLDVRDTVVDEAGAKALKERLPDCTVITSLGEF
ncbi:MAG TPA: hypothetical protein EYQ63_31850 [Fuerstia sp.]|nr:hypothetical protein [Fuerstiella sp.]